MSWIQTFALAHTVTAAILTFLLGITLAKRDRKPVENVFILLICAFLSWIVLNGLSELATILGSPSDAIGSLAGLAVIFIGYSTMVFGEFFPHGMPLRFRSERLIGAALISLPVSALVFSPDWITNRAMVEGTTRAQFGPYFYVTGSWTIVMMLSGIVVPALKYLKTQDARTRSHILLYIIGGVITLSIATIFSFLLPITGYDQLLFIGPNACVAFLALMSYAMIFHELFDLRTATLRLGVRLIISAGVGAALYGIYFLLVARQGWLEFSIQQSVPLGLLFLLGILYYPLFQRRIDHWLAPPLSGAQDLMLELFEKEGLNSVGVSVESFLKSILAAFAGALGFRQGLIVAADRFHMRLVHHATDTAFPVRNGTEERLLLMHMGVTLPEAYQRELNRIIRLEPGVPKPFEEKRDRRGRHRRMHAALRDFLQRMQDSGFQLIVPLQYRGKFYGFLAFGEKSGRLPYYSRDIRLLESVRAAVALAVRSRIEVEEIRIRKNQAEQEVSELTKFIVNKEPRRFTLKDKTLIFRSPAMGELLDRAKEAAPSPHPVLITGETGTGKELIANLIHSLSRQMSHPFVVCNCAAIPPTLFEDELFGHVKGAFTDARSTRDGIVSQAGEGTLFFDEIGEMPLDMQPKMLRLLQERKYSPVGGAQVREARCRFVFATNRDLASMVEAGAFRADLFYRINVLPLHIQPIRERKEDIPILVEYFLSQYARESENGALSIDQSAMETLLRYAWPGNVRELENTIIRAVASARNGTITQENVPLPEVYRSPGLAKIGGDARNGNGRQASGRPPADAYPLTPPDVSGLDGNYEELMQDYASKLLTYALHTSHGNKSRAAAILGIKWGKLNYKMKELGIGKQP